MEDEKKKYDVFLSYTISDNIAQKWVMSLSEQLQNTFKQMTGRQLKIFVDIHSIDTAQIWEKRIRNSLENSSLLVAVLSPSYFTSEWCSWEWDHFSERERTQRSKLQITPEQGLIFPVKLIDWGKILRLSDNEKARVNEANKRQFVDFENLQPDDPEFIVKVRQLVKSIVDALILLEESAKGGVEKVDKIAIEVLKEKQKEHQHVLRSIGKQLKLDEYTERLAKAVRVTLVGITSDFLYQCLEDALVIKRRNEGDDAFWLSLRVVFLSEDMLSNMDDDLTSEFPDKSKAAFERIRLNDKVRRSIYFFLTHKGVPHRWNLYEYNYLLPFVGTIFEMSDGTQIVQVATLRPSYSLSEYLFFEFYSHDQELIYYQSAFEDVIHRSLSDEEIVFVGNPTQNGSGFLCRHTRFRRSVLLKKADRKNDWIPAFIVLLWCEEFGNVWPLLQIRTLENADREIDMLSNISGYVNLKAYQQLEKPINSEFYLPDQCFAMAAINELSYELGLRDYKWPEPKLIKEIKFYYPDNENLYFYLCHIKVDFPINRVLPSSQLKKWSFGDILKVREVQVLSKVHNLLNTEFQQKEQISSAAQVLADNLALHRQAKLAKQLLEVIKSGEQKSEFKRDVDYAIKNAHISYRFRDKTRTILGLAGLQYREFFSSLVPFYASIGVVGAEEYMEWIQQNAHEAFARLTQHYNNPDSIKLVEIDI